MSRKFRENWKLWQQSKKDKYLYLILINLTKVQVQENRYKVNKLISATKHIINSLKEIIYIVLGVLPLRDFCVAYAQWQCQILEIILSNSLYTWTKWKFYKETCLLEDWLQIVFYQKDLKTWFRQIIKYLLGNALTLRIPTFEENNL